MRNSPTISTAHPALLGLSPTSNCLCGTSPPSPQHILQYLACRPPQTVRNFPTNPSAHPEVLDLSPTVCAEQPHQPYSTSCSTWLVANLKLCGTSPSIPQHILQCLAYRPLSVRNIPINSTAHPVVLGLSPLSVRNIPINPSAHPAVLGLSPTVCAEQPHKPHSTSCSTWLVAHCLCRTAPQTPQHILQYLACRPLSVQNNPTNPTAHPAVLGLSPTVCAEQPHKPHSASCSTWPVAHCLCGTSPSTPQRILQYLACRPLSVRNNPTNPTEHPAVFGLSPTSNCAEQPHKPHRASCSAWPVAHTTQSLRNSPTNPTLVTEALPTGPPRHNRRANGLLYLFFVDCLASQQQAGVSQGRICSDNFTCSDTEIVVADQTFYLTQSQYTDTGPTSPSADPISPGAWQGSHRSANF